MKAVLPFLTTMMAVAVVNGQPVFVQDYESSLDTTKASMQLDDRPAAQKSRARKSGYTYEDIFRTESSSTVTTMGMEVKTEEMIQIENEMTVQDMTGGGQQFTITTTRMLVEINSAGVEMHCDSEKSTNDDICAAMLDSAGQTLVLTVDDVGNIVDVGGEGADSAQKFIALTQGEDKDHDSAQLKDQVSALSRVLQFIPDQVVKPGDTWQMTADMGDMGSVDGVCSLSGYREYDGSDVAVIFMDGKLHMEMGKLMETMGLGAGMLENDHVEADMTQAIFWDYEEDLALWSEANTSMVLKMNNPLGGTMEVPSFSSVYIVTTIKDKPAASLPDPVREPASDSGSDSGSQSDSGSESGDETTGAIQANAAKETSGGSSGPNGKGTAALVLGLFALVAAVSLVAYKRSTSKQSNTKMPKMETEFASLGTSEGVMS